MADKKSPGIYFGWWTVIAGGLVALWGAGFYSYGISALFKPISGELGFSRTATSVPASIGRLEGGFEAPLVGWLTDRFGPKWIILAGVLLTATGLLLMKFMNSLWAFYVIWGVIVGTGHNITSGVPVDKAITNWFVKKRGLALGIKWAFSGLSGIIVLPFVAWLIATQGWRTTCVIGGLLGIIGIPLIWFAVKQHRPEYYGLLPDGAAAREATAKGDQMVDRGVKYATEVEEVEFTLRQAAKTPTFWLLILSFSVHSLAGPALSIHGIPFLTDQGIDPLKAASMLGIMIGASVPARLLGGFLADRVRKSELRFLMGGAFLLQVLGIGTYLLNQSVTMIYVWFVTYGLGMGIGYALMSPVRARYFGRKAFGSISGTITLITMPVGVAAPVYLGWVYDTTASYISAFMLIAALLAFAAVVAFLIPTPKPPARITDLHNIL